MRSTNSVVDQALSRETDPLLVAGALPKPKSSVARFERLDTEPTSWYGKLWAGTKNVVSNTWDKAKSAGRVIQAGAKVAWEFYKENPIKMTIALLLCLPVGSPNGINAGTLITGHSTNELANVTQWFPELPKHIQGMSITAVIAATGVNAALFIFTIVMLATNFAKLRDDFKTSTLLKVLIPIGIVLGITAGFPAFAINFDSYFSWAGAPIAAIVAILGGSLTIAGRTFGATNLPKRIKKYYTPEATTQRDFANTLRLIDPRIAAIVQYELECAINLVLQRERKTDDAEKLSEPLSQKESRKVLIIFAENLRKRNIAQSLAGIVLFKKNKDCKYRCIETGGWAFDITFALAMGASAYITFSQKGFDGVNLAVYYLGNNTNFVNMTDTATKAAIGAIPAIPSFLSYAEAASVFRMMMVYYFRSLPSYPGTAIPVGVFIAFVTFCSALANSEIIRRIVLNPDNIYGFRSGISATFWQNLAANTQNVAFFAGGTVANGRFYEKLTRKPPAFAVTVQDVIDSASRYEENFVEDDKELLEGEAPPPGQNSILIEVLDADNHPVQMLYPVTELGKQTKDAMKAITNMGLFQHHPQIEVDASVQPRNTSVNGV